MLVNAERGEAVNNGSTHMVKELLHARIITGRVMSSVVGVCAKRFHITDVMPAKAGIQYAAASRFRHCRLGVLDRPVKPGDDTECVARGTCNIIVIARSACDEAIQSCSAERFWIASRSPSSGRASRGPVGSQ
ncbi:hypothetical protein EAS62_36495 [Bradyrhizobium zhanjiangense]|uniref:Uncharacterized protein n=1 Tax=Bradyrhizobium zhanjiangense TaxID=1325107 RepID=A0ABY0D9L2_9BRAD|nr:hypothetical protein EAS62_36495 [Bradyrhizobium zhanjiangense]